MPKTEDLLHRIDLLEKETGVRRTIFAACPNSTAVISASIRAAKRNNAPIYFAATLNQIDCDGGYTGMTQAAFTRLISFEVERNHFTGPVIIAIDHGGPWLKDRQRTEKWSVKDAMDGVKKSFEAAVLAGYDLIHVDPTVDINVPKGEIIDIVNDGETKYLIMDVGDTERQLVVLENQTSTTSPTMGRRYVAYADVNGQYMYQAEYYPLLIARYMDLSSN